MPMIEKLKNRVVVKLLHAMKPTQRAEFELFLQSPLNNRDPQIVSLLQFVQATVFPAPRKAKGQSLEAATGITDSLQNKAFSQLFMLLNQYLESEERKSRKLEGFRYLFHAYQKLGVEENIIAKEWKKAQKLIQHPPQEIEALHLQYQLAHKIGLGEVDADRRKILTHFEDNQILLDRYYVTSRLKYLCASRNQELVLNQPRNDLGENEVRLLFKSNPAQMPPTAYAYLKALDLLSGNESTLNPAEELQEWLKTHQTQIASEDLLDIWGYILNDCIRKISQGNVGLEAQLSQIYAYLVQNGILEDNGKLPSFHFSNILKVFLSNKAWENVDFLIAKYGDNLTNDFGGAMQDYAEALVNYRKGNFKRAVIGFKKMLEYHLEDIFWNLEFRSLLWKSYFENLEQLSLTELDELDALYDSFRIYVSRTEQITPSTRENYKNFIRLFNRLRTLLESAEVDQNSLLELKELVKKTEKVGSKEWLLKQIDKFLK